MVLQIELKKKDLIIEIIYTDNLHLA